MEGIYPEDIVYRILSRLPIKSLARFLCVCKLWLKYINDPYLRTIHVQEEPTPIMFERFPFERPWFRSNKIRISFLRGMQKDPVLELDYRSTCDEGPLLGSCNGLTLVSYEHDPHADGTYRFAVISPLTKEHHDLPPISIEVVGRQLDGPCDAAGIGFDDSTNTLKTMFYILKDRDLRVACTMVHSLGMSSWREIAQTPAYPIRGEGVFAHGRLHWLATFYWVPRDGRKIVWFDVKREKFGLMDPPKKVKHLNDDELFDFNGEVGFSCRRRTCFKLWILKQGEWMLHCCFDLSVFLPQHYENNVDVSGRWNKDGDILFSYNGGKHLFVYTLKDHDLRQLELRDPCQAHAAEIRMCQSSLFSVTSARLFDKKLPDGTNSGN